MRMPTKTKCRFNGILAYFTFSIVLLGTNLPATASAEEAPLVHQEPAVREALLAEDWNRVAELLEQQKESPLSPVEQFLKGHVYLATNKNNESYCSFVEASKEDGVNKWDQWTKELMSPPNKPAVVYYLRGDALARQKDWAKAKEIFKAGLEVDEDHALTLNALGVVYAANQQWDKAIGAFRKAMENMPMLADAYANRSAVNINRKEGIKGVLKWVKRALEASPEFGLAFNSRAGANFVRGSLIEAERDFRNAEEINPCASVIATNIEKIITRITARTVSTKKISGSKEASMHINKTFKDMMKTDASFSSVDRFQAEFSHLSPRQQDVQINRINKYGAGNTTFSQNFGRHINSLNRISRDGSPLHSMAGIYRDSSFGDIKIGGGRVVENGLTQIHKSTSTLMNQTASGQRSANGVDVNLANAQFDQGNWPFISEYGLFYPPITEASSM